MAAAVAAGGDDLVVFVGVAGFVCQRRKRIVFTKQSDDGFPFAPAADESGRDPGDSFLYRKALGLQHISEGLGRLKFLEAELRIAPHLIRCVQKLALFGVYQCLDFLYGIHVHPSKRKFMQN